MQEPKLLPCSFTLTDRFSLDRCTGCGTCLRHCPVMQLPETEARAEIARLASGGNADVLNRCSGCMACNAFCPNRANPHALITSGWLERRRRDGTPTRVRLFLPHQKPNLFTLGCSTLPPDERALVNQWECAVHALGHERSYLFAGCNLLLQPFLVDSSVYRGLPILGAVDLCCGEPLCRMGAWDEARRVATRVAAKIRNLSLDRLILPCLACYHVFKQVYPEVFGLDLGCQLVTIEDWLCDRIASGTLALRSLGKTAAIHDNCWSSAAGSRLHEQVRNLLGHMGVRVAEPFHTRERTLCCGMCAGAARYRLRDVLTSAQKRLHELSQTQADFIVTYCGGCHWLFNLVSQLPLAGRPLPCWHLFELLELASGGTPKRRARERTRALALRLAPRMALGWMDRRRVRL